MVPGLFFVCLFVFLLLTVIGISKDKNKEGVRETLLDQEHKGIRLSPGRGATPNRMRSVESALQGTVSMEGRQGSGTDLCKSAVGTKAAL